ncbi:E3 ubiquitin-protein ligase ATL41 [Cajanus cajan]|uniref:RING-type E3 ubiquitin transferase n=1 Tax=Cajanus cajan TaxID=3821 RepID=A0A151SEX1_CAJCA|nr:E3 ubiquitin-protein ligase ATL41 [Cajanus cajan]KYP53319.1 RING-H2 finger protein ATL2L [Cajanus cajan]
MSYFDDDHDHDHDHFPDHSDFNRRILITAIVSLTAVLVLVVALHLYARFVLRRQSRRRNAIHLLTLNVAHAHNHAEPPNTGLDPTLITTLPTFPFKQEHDSVECSVCLSVLEDGELVRLLPNCKHSFHVSCIDTWLTSHSTCPLCRTKAEPPRLEPQPREGPAVASDGSPKIGGSSNSRLSSFRRILSRERSSTRIQPSTNDDVQHDLERQ